MNTFFLKAYLTLAQLNPLDTPAEGNDYVVGKGDEKVTIKNPLRDDIKNVSDLINILVNFILSIGLVIVLAMFVYGGFILLTSRGNPENMKKAKGIFTSSIIGMILLTLAFLITRVVGFIFGFEGGILPTN